MIEELTRADLDNLKEFGAEAGDGSTLQIELNGDLFFSFEEPETGLGEMLGLVAAVLILLLAFGSVIAMGLPIGMALFGLALGISSMSIITYFIDIPSFAPQMGAMIGLGVGIDYALFVVSRHREHLARGMTVQESVGRAVATAGQACHQERLGVRHRRHYLSSGAHGTDPGPRTGLHRRRDPSREPYRTACL